MDRLQHFGLAWIIPAWIAVGVVAHFTAALIRRRTP